MESESKIKAMRCKHGNNLMECGPCMTKLLRMVFDPLADREHIECLREEKFKVMQEVNELRGLLIEADYHRVHGKGTHCHFCECERDDHMSGCAVAMAIQKRRPSDAE